MSLTFYFSFCKSVLQFLGNKKIWEGSEFHIMYMCGWDVHMCADCITLASPTLCSEVSLPLVWALLKSKQTHDKAMVNEGRTGCGGFRSLRRELYTSDQSSLCESETDSHNETIGVEKGRKNQASGWVPLKRGPQYSRPIHDTAAARQTQEREKRLGRDADLTAGQALWS